MSAAGIFSAFQDYLNEEQDKREEIRVVVRELEQKAREILTVQQGVHQPEGIKQIPSICESSRTLFEDVKTKFAELAEKIPPNQYYRVREVSQCQGSCHVSTISTQHFVAPTDSGRFHDHWRFVMQRLCFLASLTIYLESEELIARNQCAQMLGVKEKREDGFHMDLDDYLMGLLQLASELSRLAVNAVTSGDYGRPKKIGKFVGEMDSGFRLLNLKNDSLRKRFDGLKYDLKKVEEVVYDVTIRGLAPKEEAATPTN